VACGDPTLSEGHVHANSEILLIGGPDTATALHLRLYQSITWPILVSAGLPEKTVIAVAASAIACVIEGPPIIETSTQMSANFADPSAPLVDVGGTLAQPVANLWQSDLVGLKLRWSLSWCVRDPRGVAERSPLGC
jgi:hypothetical protein